ncbi:MAG: acetyl-CoA carboxylase carboxyltransferase component [Saprospiraceae bacterium]|jgi:acetyl-CoA carboxylase carboxyltransferase component
MKESNKPKDLREDLEELLKRKSYLLDENRPDAVAKRRKKNQRTARENINDLCTKFKELGSLIVAGQKGRMSRQDLIEKTPADGLITGIGEINSNLFGKEISKCLILSYDYTVMAGTQGGFNHKKTDRMMSMARQMQKPVIFFVEGGGGRPGDVDFNATVIGGLDLMTWVEYAKLSGKVPRVAIVEGYCFAGNAAIAGCADVIIATKSVSIGMGGPSMIEGGGLGKFHPTEIGPAKMQATNGVIDILVKDEAAAVDAAKKYISYFQGDLKDWKSGDQEILRDLIPENRKFAYNVHKVIKALCDEDSVLELRSEFARNMVTALVRIEGKPMGLIANSTRHLGGAIDSDAADKVARFMQLCDAFGLPLLSLCDAPGFMVGPDHEKTAMVRHTSRMFVNAAALQVPVLTVILRKAYGLGAMAMAGGSLHASFFTIAWPTAEFGAMGLEGAVKLGFKKEMDAVTDPIEKQALYDKLVKTAYRKGKAVNAAHALEFDEVIDPAETREYLVAALESIPKSTGSGRFIDTW